MCIKLWMRVIRAPFFTASAVPAVLGTSIAFQVTGLFSPFLFALALLGTILLHAGANLANDFFDHKSGNDEENKSPTPFSGGSRVIQEGLISPGSILGASLVSFTIGSLIGLYLFFTLGFPILVIGLVGVFLGFFYTAKPFRLGYSGLGEIAVAISFGPLIVAGAYYVQTLSLSIEALLASVPIGILIGVVLLMNEFQDREPDRKTGKKTLVVRLGKERSLNLYQSSLALSYAWIVAGAFLGLFPVTALLVLLTLPLAFTALKVSRKNFNGILELLPANASTIALHISFGLLLSAAYLFGVFL